MYKRTLTLGLHHWNENDLILNFYFTKFGTRSIYIKSEEELSKFIGTTPCSFKKQSMNFRYLMGCKSGVLSDYSKLQNLVFELFDEIPFYEFHQIVKGIIGQDDHERREIFVRKGYNPDRMIRLN
jgi:hypothetical protein